MRNRALDLLHAGVFGLGLLAIACGGGKTDEKADATSAEKTDQKEGEDGTATAAPPTTAVVDETGEAPPEAGETGTGAAAAEGEAAETGAAEAGAADPTAAAETGAAASPEEQLKTLFDEVANKKTKDERAIAALEEAKALEAKPKDLATAANKRGEKLLGSSADRATTFFEWAQAADPKYPNATFNLAKLAANTGDIPRVKELLTDVRARGGKKLLQQVEFDPSFALVADDPEVLALLR